MGNTKTDLVRDLENSVISNEMHPKVRAIIEKAKDGFYHDFDTLIATPKMQLHLDLLDAGLNQIDQKMQNGDYDDEEPTPAQEKEMIDSLVSSIKK